MKNKKTTTKKAGAQQKRTTHLGLSDAEFEKFSKGCRTTWNIVGSETLAIEGRASMTRNDVIILVLDGYYLREYGWRWQSDDQKHETDWQKFYDKTIKPLLKKENTAEFKKMMAAVFPKERYL